jgi:hypothetical protein
VEAPNESISILKTRVVRELEHIRQSIPVSGDGRPGFALRIQRLFASGGRNCVLLGDIVAFDAVRSTNSASKGIPSQKAKPAFGGTQCRAKVIPNGINLLYHIQAFWEQFRYSENHVLSAS